ncbi:MAG: Rrf2 family transcriptional regulator [Polyangiaceae bacterium]
MRLTLRTDYALRALMALAEAGERGATAGEIAEAYGVSTGHMRKVLQALTGLALVHPGRGRGQRSHLALPPAAISVGAVVRALEPLEVVECFADPSEGEGCRLMGRCTLAGRLGAAQEAFLATLDTTSLADVASSAERLELVPLRRRPAQEASHP